MRSPCPFRLEAFGPGKETSDEKKLEGRARQLEKELAEIRAKLKALHGRKQE
jgi:hypothetical protein